MDKALVASVQEEMAATLAAAGQTRMPLQRALAAAAAVEDIQRASGAVAAQAMEPVVSCLEETGGNGGVAGGAGGGGGAAMGGAFFSRSGTHTFRHCTFSDNQAIPGGAGNSSSGNASDDGLGRGGAIGTYSGNLTMDNCLIYNNVAMGSPSGDLEDVFLNNNGPIAAVQGFNLVGVMAGNAETEFDAAATGNFDWSGSSLACVFRLRWPNRRIHDQHM